MIQNWSTEFTRCPKHFRFGSALETIRGISEAIKRYAHDVQSLSNSETTSELTYYPALRALLAELLKERRLPSNVRTNTTERREGGGVDLPDIAVYDDAGDIPLLFVEVKLPNADIHELAQSIERNNQVGRYLARSHAILVTNARAFALITVEADAPRGPVLPASRKIEQVVELWPSLGYFKAGKPTSVLVEVELADLLEWALSAFATISEPAALAKVLANQARRRVRDWLHRCGKYCRQPKPVLRLLGRRRWPGSSGGQYCRRWPIEGVGLGDDGRRLKVCHRTRRRMPVASDPSTASAMSIEGSLVPAQQAQVTVTVADPNNLGWTSTTSDEGSQVIVALANGQSVTINAPQPQQVQV